MLLETHISNHTFNFDALLELVGFMELIQVILLQQFVHFVSESFVFKDDFGKFCLLLDDQVSNDLIELNILSLLLAHLKHFFSMFFVSVKEFTEYKFLLVC